MLRTGSFKTLCECSDKFQLLLWATSFKELVGLLLQAYKQLIKCLAGSRHRKRVRVMYMPQVCRDTMCLK